MNAVRRLIGLFRDSPTFGRDRANLISGFTIGSTALFLNGAVLVMVLPLLLDPNDRDFRMLTEKMEFGQLLGLILQGGATVFATVLIPMRLVTVFLAPRIGRYFDQIVLSGISPFRFLIGKATSQNLFLLLILFLLLPWFTLVLTLGGLEWPVFLGNLLLVWLYCMMLALVMLWLSLYMNEFLAMGVVIAGAALLLILGCIPMLWQPFVLTPAPALVYSVFRLVDDPDFESAQDYVSVFASCAAGMSAVIVASLVAISIGPLYGIIRDNSTFGEVVRAGDSRRKRRLRFRLHIQRPSELAFFYENRGDAFRRYEGLIRWSVPFVILVILISTPWTLMLTHMARRLTTAGGIPWSGWVFEFHAFFHVFHGIGILIAAFLFSHGRNTTFQQVMLLPGWRVRVSTLDTVAFLGYLLLSTGAALGLPLWFEQAYVIPAGVTLFPELRYVTYGEPADYHRTLVEGTLSLTVAGLTIYALQRMVCLTMWLKSAAMAAVAFLYGAFICIFPWITIAFLIEFTDIMGAAAARGPEGVPAPFMAWAMTSPLTVMAVLHSEFTDRMNSPPSTAPFYIAHAVVIVACLILMKRSASRLRLQYSVLRPEEQR